MESFIPVSYTHLDVYKRQLSAIGLIRGLTNWGWPPSATPAAIVASLMKEYPLKSVPVDNPFAFSISITAFDFNPYLSQSPITGSVSKMCIRDSTKRI